MPDAPITEVAQGVHRLGDGHVNWYLVEEGRDRGAGRSLTLVDAGMPGHWPMLAAGLSALGRRLADVEAIVLTHAHVDHTGFAERARRARASTARASATGAGGDGGGASEDGGGGDLDVLVQEWDADVSVRKLPPLLLFWRPTSWPLFAGALREGLLLTPPVTVFTTFGDDAVLDVPGRPRAVHVPGHTLGSAALHLADRGVVLTGDALVTFDPYTRARGPRLMLDGVNEDPAQARSSLDRLAALDAEVVLPGHGEPFTGGVAAAVRQARG